MVSVFSLVRTYKPWKFIGCNIAAILCVAWLMLMLIGRIGTFNKFEIQATKRAHVSDRRSGPVFPTQTSWAAEARYGISASVSQCITNLRCQRADETPVIAVPRLTQPLTSREDAARNGLLIEESAYCVAQCGNGMCCMGAQVKFHDIKLLTRQSDDVQHSFYATDVTMVTHGTASKLKVFRKQLQNWPGPVVAVFVVYNNTNALAASAAAERTILERFVSTLRSNVRVYLYTVKVPPASDIHGKKMMTEQQITLYPVNTLRNFGVDAALTPWVFPLDMDFVPSATLYASLRCVHIPRFRNVAEVALVVPHFELGICQGDIELEPPKSFNDLVTMLSLQVAFPFKSRSDRLIPAFLNATFVEGLKSMGTGTVSHAGNLTSIFDVQNATCSRPSKAAWPWGILETNYSKWMEQSMDFVHGGVLLLPIHGLYSEPRNAYKTTWEPFVAFDRNATSRTGFSPRYDEKYIGRYRNKVHFTSLLRANAYKFLTVLREFVVHVPHVMKNPKSRDMQMLKDAMIDMHVSDMRDMLRRQDATRTQRPTLVLSAVEHEYRCTLS